MMNEEIKAVAKQDTRILMKDGQFSDFRKGNTYRCLWIGNKAVLIDENKTGFACDKPVFEEHFEKVKE